MIIHLDPWPGVNTTHATSVRVKGQTALNIKISPLQSLTYDILQSIPANHIKWQTKYDTLSSDLQLILNHR